jgi:hypothetical protein
MIGPLIGAPLGAGAVKPFVRFGQRCAARWSSLTSGVVYRSGPIAAR